MKIRQGFVSNSSSSSFVIALPKIYTLSDEEMEAIREKMEDYDEYFSHYEQLAEEAGETELLDERERIQKMLETSNFEEVEEVDPVNDDVKNKDIQKGFELLTTKGYLWLDDVYENEPEAYAAKAIIQVLKEKIEIGSMCSSSEGSQVVNVLADEFIESKGMKIVSDYYRLGY